MIFVAIVWIQAVPSSSAAQRPAEGTEPALIREVESEFKPVRIVPHWSAQAGAAAKAAW